MNQAAFQERLRQMRFKEAYEGYQSNRLSQSEAATLLGICDRSFRRYMHRYEDSGMDGLLDRRLNEPSQRRAPVDEMMALQDLYSTRYQGWNVRHFHRWYQRDHEGQRSYSWVKKQLQSAGLVRKSKTPGPHRKKRAPSALAGMMIHQD
ncbi:MAG: transposase, partial [Gammaproteobacteria bacterium]